MTRANGATVQYREVFRRLTAAGVSCAVLTVVPRDASPRSGRASGGFDRIGRFLAGVPVVEYHLRPGSAKAAPDAYREALRRALREFAPDTVVLNTPPDRLEEAEVILAEVVAEAGVACWCFVPDADFPRPDTVTADQLARLLAALRTARLLVPSRFLQRKLHAAGFPAATLFPNLFTPSRIVAARGDRRYVTLINPHPMKGIEIFERVAALLPWRDFLVVRGWPYPPVYEKPALPNVTVRGFTEDIREVWADTAVLVVPSLCEEGFGRVVVEAQLNGIPVIAHRIGGLVEAAGGAAILIDPPPRDGRGADVRVAPDAAARADEEWARAIERVLCDRRLVSHLAARGRSTARAICWRAERSFERFLARSGRQRRRQPPRVAFLAPHPDDVAISCGGLALALAPHGVLVTVFGRSNYTQAHGFHRDWRRVTARRRYEDARYSRAARFRRWMYLGLPEAGLRVGASFDDVFAAADDRDAADATIVAALDRALRDARPDVLVVPLGFGLHKDHLAVRNAARALAVRDGRPIFFYEDLDYVASLNEAEIADFVRAWEPRLTPVYVPLAGRLDEKLAHLSLYASQLGAPEREAARRHARRWHDELAFERLWSQALPGELTRWLA